MSYRDDEEDEESLYVFFDKEDVEFTIEGRDYLDLSKMGLGECPEGESYPYLYCKKNYSEIIYQCDRDLVNDGGVTLCFLETDKKPDGPITFAESRSFGWS